MAETSETLANVLTVIAEAHHQAFISTDGADPEWPIWYAERLQKLVSSLLNTPISRSEIVYLLAAAERAQQAEESDVPWPEFYANHMIKHYRPE